MSICLYASEVAIITGHNKYKKVSELITLIWKIFNMILKIQFNLLRK